MAGAMRRSSISPTCSRNRNDARDAGPATGDLIVRTSIWLHPWDLEGWEPAALVDRLRALGLDACQLALAYHATRMVLPAHRRRRLFETAHSAIYFPLAPASGTEVSPGDKHAAAGARHASAAEVAHGGLCLEGWTPPVAPEAALTPPFLAACRDAGFPVSAWVVLCHQDGVDGGAAALCVTNVYGDRYGYALCPSQPAVQAWAAALCAAAAGQPGVDALDIEAASFLGVDHQSAHDKRGVPLPASIAWLLSICVCPACRRALDPACADEIASRARGTIDAYFRGWPMASALSSTSVPAPTSAPVPASAVALRLGSPAIATSDGGALSEALTAALGEDLLRRLLDARDRAQIALLTAIRQRVPDTRLLLRLASSPLFIGGKTALPLRALGGLADAAVMTWLGADLAVMRADLETLPPPDARAVPLEGGFTLHAADCRAPEDVEARLDLLRTAGFDSAIAYCYGLASDAHLSWLRDATYRRRTG
jgi:hypothetical protein